MNRWNDYEQVPKGKNHVFYDGKEFIKVNVELLASVLSDEINQEFSNLLENFLQSNNGTALLRLEIKPSTIENKIHYKDLKKGFLMKVIVKNNAEKLNLQDLKFTPYYFIMRERNNIKEIRRDYYDIENYDKYLMDERTKVNSYLNKKHPNESSYTQEQMLKCLTDLKYGQLFIINSKGQSVHKTI